MKKRIFNVIALSLLALTIELNATAQNVPSFNLELQVQVDGRQPVTSGYALPNSRPTPIILPTSLWSCWVRPTTSTSTQFGTFYLKELVCIIHDDASSSTLTQVGTSTTCLGNSPHTAQMYIREGNRRLFFTLTCSP